MSDPLFDMLANVARQATKDMVALESAKTFNSLLDHEVLELKSTEHFERIDSHYTADGVLVKYRCNLDGRTYSVKITADKGSGPGGV